MIEAKASSNKATPMTTNPYKGEPGGLQNLYEEMMACLIIEIPGLDIAQWKGWMDHDRVYNEDDESWREDFPEMEALEIPGRPGPHATDVALDRFLKRNEKIRLFNLQIANIRAKTFIALRDRCDVSFYSTWEGLSMDAKACFDYLIDAYGFAARGIIETSHELSGLLQRKMKAPESLLNYWVGMEKSALSAGLTLPNLISLIMIDDKMNSLGIKLLPAHLDEARKHVIDQGLNYEEAKKWLIRKDTVWRC